MHSHFKKIPLFLLFVGLSFLSFAQLSNNPVAIPQGGTKNFSGLEGEDAAKNDDKVPEVYYASRFLNVKLDRVLGTKTPTGQDTLPLNFQKLAFPERTEILAGSFLYNLGAPFQSKIFIDQTDKSAFLFGKAYEYWLTAPEEQIYYNTTTPYTNVRYLTTYGNDISQEENFKFLFTVNLNKRLNLGFDYEILYSRGFYENNANRDKLANIFGNYRSPKYEAYWRYSQNLIDNRENGGITDDRYITQPLLMSGGMREYESLNIPVALSDASNHYRNKNVFLHHEYHLGFDRIDILLKDTALKSAESDTIHTFVPVTSITHTLLIDQSQKNYRSGSVNAGFYGNIAYLNSTSTKDTSALLQVRNIVALKLEEGFHKWAQLGLTAYLEHDFRKYTSYSPQADNIIKNIKLVDSVLLKHSLNLFWVGGEVTHTTSDLLNFTANGKLCILGEQLGDFLLQGKLSTKFNMWGKPVRFLAEGSLRNDHPDYFMEHYQSNHFRWNNNFSNTYRTTLSGNLDLPFVGLNATAQVDNLTNFLYFNANALPTQFLGNIQVLTVKIKEKLKTGILHFDNTLAWQLSGKPDVLPLPDLAVYSDLYLKFMLSKVMTSHLGIDCRYHTSYYAPTYMPALSQFYVQHNQKVGNYPFINFYGNFHLKRMRFYVQYSHASRLFVSPNYFSIPHYPMNPTILKAGLSWNFYD